MNLLTRVVNIDELQKKGILINLFMIHDMNEVFDVTQKCKEISLKDLIKQNLVMTAFVDFVQLTAIKNYFGEKEGFHYAFVNFYNVYFAFPALIGILTTLRQYQIQSFITLWSFAYALAISIWITVFIELWRRQQN